MKIKFVKITLTLSLLLMAVAPISAFAGTTEPSCETINCERSSKECLKDDSYFKFDGSKEQFVPIKNQNCGNQNQGILQKARNNCNTNLNNCNGNLNNCNGNLNNCNGNLNNCTVNNNCNNSVKPDKPSKPDNSVKPDKPNNNVGSYEKQVAALVNKQRAKAGLAPLTVNAKLSNVAETKAADMRDNNYFSHTSPTYGSPFDMMKKFGVTYSSAGENIAKGQNSPESVMNAWMNSSGHKANIMSSNFEEIGVGYTTDSKGNTYWVQMFIK